MKNLISIFLFLILNLSFAQNSNLAKEVVKDIIENRPIRNGEIRIISKMHSHEDFFTRKLDQNKGIIYDQKAKINPDSIHLTVKERDYLTIEFRKQVDNFVWEKDELKPYQVIPVEEALPFLRQNNNAVIRISNPLFIRNNTIAMVFFGYSPFRDSFYSLSFYKKIKGVWRNWICVRATKQGDKE